MKICQYEFAHICDIEPQKEKNGLVTSFAPQDRYKHKNRLPLNKYGAGNFCKFTIPKGYKVSGVYAILINKELKYIGECVNLSSRFNSGYGNISPRNCFKGGQETNCRINKLIYNAAKNGDDISLLFLNTGNHRTIENGLILMNGPDWNRTKSK
jgi:hypothetical protein